MNYIVWTSDKQIPCMIVWARDKEHVISILQNKFPEIVIKEIKEDVSCIQMQ